MKKKTLDEKLEENSAADNPAPTTLELQGERKPKTQKNWDVYCYYWICTLFCTVHNYHIKNFPREKPNNILYGCCFFLRWKFFHHCKKTNCSLDNSFFSKRIQISFTLRQFTYVTKSSVLDCHLQNKWLDLMSSRMKKILSERIYLLLLKYKNSKGNLNLFGIKKTIFFFLFFSFEFGIAWREQNRNLGNFFHVPFWDF